MPFMRAAALAACIALASATSVAAEIAVTFEVHGQRIAGVLDVPDGVKHPPVVLMLHEYTGTRNEWSSKAVPEGLFGRCARAMQNKGVASLRFDFRGSGESDGKFEDVTVESEITDALAAIDFLKTRKDVDSGRVSVIGMSLGGAVAAAVAGRTHHKLQSVVLWNPGINLPAAFTSIYGEEVIKAGLSAGDKPISVTPRGGGKTVSLHSGFFESLYGVVPAAEIAHYRGPLLLAIGTSDTIVFPQPTSAKALLRYHPGPHELWTRPVDHGFDVEQSAATVDELIEHTTMYVKAYSARPS